MTFPDGTLPPDAPLRVVGDVHGDASGFAAALAGAPFVVQLGDLTDAAPERAPDSAEVLRLALDMLDANRGMFLLGNHDHKLARALEGRGVRIAPALAATLAALPAALAARALAAIRAAPAWARCGESFFVHGAFHSAMLTQPPPAWSARPDGVLSRALFGQTTARRQPDGFPERVLDWVDRIPAGMTVYCGHDDRSSDGRPARRRGAAGGEAVFMDTGAGKGGHLSWVDLPPRTAGEGDRGCAWRD